MPTIYKDQAIVPPPAYHHAQGRLRPALHSDILSERQHVALVHAVPFGLLIWLIVVPPHLCLQALEAYLAPTVTKYSS